MQQTEISLYDKIKQDYNETLIILGELKKQKEEDELPLPHFEQHEKEKTSN